jgi:beta-arabinofuranosyltransferase
VFGPFGRPAHVTGSPAPAVGAAPHDTPSAHEQHSVDPSDQPLEFNSRKAPDMPIHTTVASNHDAAEASTHSWMPSVALGFHSRPPVPPQVAQVNINCTTHPFCYDSFV